MVFEELNFEENKITKHSRVVYSLEFITTKMMVVSKGPSSRAIAVLGSDSN